MNSEILASQIQHYQPDQIKEDINGSLKRNNRVFVGIVFFFQILFFFLHGFFVRPVNYPPQSSPAHALFIATGVAALVLVGFGLLLSYMKNLSWSSLGFNLLIVSFCFQLYFLVNGFWSKAGIQETSQYFALPDKTIPIRLSQNYANYESQTKSDGATVVSAFKCSLSMIVAFSALLGKAGPLQAIIVSIPGVILYELNRQLISKFSIDFGGSISIFAFGGFYGSAIALVLYFKHRQLLHRHQSFVSSKFSASLAGIGSLFCWIFFPLLSVDFRQTMLISYFGGINSIYTISTCVVASCAINTIIYNSIKIRDLVYSPVVAGVIIGSSSNIIYYPVYSMILGIIAAGFLVLFNYIDRKLAQYSIFSSNTFFLFGLMGLFGGLASAVIRSLVSISSIQYTEFLASFPQAKFQIIATFVSVGIGAIAGIIVGFILYCFNSHRGQDNFNDYAYWIKFNDGISNNAHFQKHEVLIIIPPKQIKQDLKGANAYL